MAKIKIKFGETEIEIDSRDFYVDNHSIGKVIDGITQSMCENRARLSADGYVPQKPISDSETSFGGLGALEDVEAYEPEFIEPSSISISEVREKLKLLESESFFDMPRTVSDTAAQLRKHGWAASLLDVSKVLAKMAFNKEIIRNSQEHRNYYFTKKVLLST